MGENKNALFAVGSGKEVLKKKRKNPAPQKVPKPGVRKKHPKRVPPVEKSPAKATVRSGPGEKRPRTKEKSPGERKGGKTSRSQKKSRFVLLTPPGGNKATMA